MRKLMLAAAMAAMPLGGCATLPATPADLAGQTLLDEKAAIGAELSYTAAAKAATLAIRANAVSDPATIAKIGELDRKAYAAVQATREAYNAGNAASYAEAFTRAQGAVSALLAAI